MKIEFNLPHVFYPGSSAVENAEVLRASLDYMIAINRAYLRAHAVPALYRSGVRYARTKVWEPIPALYQRKLGDCKSLATARAAELLEAGIPCRVVFRWVKRISDGGLDFHILILKEDGTHEDPSRTLGMGQYEQAFFNAPYVDQ